MLDCSLAFVLLQRYNCSYITPISSFRKCYGNKSSAKQTLAPKFLIDSTILSLENCNNQFGPLPVGDFTLAHDSKEDPPFWGTNFPSCNLTGPNKPTNQPTPTLSGSDALTLPFARKPLVVSEKWWTREKAKKPVENWAEKISQHQKIPWSLPPTTVAFFSWRISQGRNDINISWSGWWSRVIFADILPSWVFLVHLTKPKMMQVATFQVPCLPLRPTRFHPA